MPLHTQRQAATLTVINTMPLNTTPPPIRIPAHSPYIA